MSLVNCFVVSLSFTAPAGSKASKVLESMFSVRAPLQLCMLAWQAALPAHFHVDRHVPGFYVLRRYQSVPVSVLKTISVQGGCMISERRFLSVWPLRLWVCTRTISHPRSLPGCGRESLDWGWERLERQELAQEFSKAKFWSNHILLRLNCNVKDSRIGGSFELYSSVTSVAVQWERPPAAGRRGSTALLLKVGRFETCLVVFRWLWTKKILGWVEPIALILRPPCRWKTRSHWKWSPRPTIAVPLTVVFGCVSASILLGNTCQAERTTFLEHELRARRYFLSLSQSAVTKVAADGRIAAC